MEQESHRVTESDSKGKCWMKHLPSAFCQSALLAHTSGVLAASSS